MSQRTASVPHELRATPTKIHVRTTASGKREIKGVAIVANSLSEDLGGFREIITVEAIRKAFTASDDCLLLYSHLTEKLLARESSSTLKLSLTNEGNLAFTAELADNALADEVLSLLARKDLKSMSFGFQCLADQWAETPQGLVRTVTEFELFEISVVAQPAYKATSASLRNAPASVRTKLQHLLIAKRNEDNSTFGPDRVVIKSQSESQNSTAVFARSTCNCTDDIRDLHCERCNSDVYFMRSMRSASGWSRFACGCAADVTPKYKCRACSLPYDPTADPKPQTTVLEEMQEAAQAASRCVNHRCEVCSATWSDDDEDGDEDQQQDTEVDSLRARHLALIQKRLLS